MILGLLQAPAPVHSPKRFKALTRIYAPLDYHWMSVRVSEKGSVGEAVLETDTGRVLHFSAQAQPAPARHVRCSDLRFRLGSSPRGIIWYPLLRYLGLHNTRIRVDAFPDPHIFALRLASIISLSLTLP